MTAPLYHATPPGPLMERLYRTFSLRPGYVSYLRQEATMLACPPTPTAQRLALATDLLERIRALRALRQQEAEEEQIIVDVWAQLEALDAAQRAPVAPRREE